MYRTKTWMIVAAMACASGISFAQTASSPQNESGPMSTTRQPLVVVTGASTGEGISYLPFTLMKEHKLVEKQAAKYGVQVATEWQRFPKPIPMREALVDGKIAFAAGGVTQLLATWELTRNTDNKVKGIGTLNSMPLTLISSNPSVKALTDFTAKDKIAVPAVRTSIQAVVLAMASEKAFGKGQADKIEPFTMFMSHPDATKALINGNSEVNAHVSSAPFVYEELAKPEVHKVLDSYDVLGGPHTYNAVWTSTKFDDANPKIVEAYIAALEEAHEMIKADPAAAAALWLRTENIENITPAQVEAIIRDPQNEWTTTPKKFMAFATFMNQIGQMSTKPASLQDLFFGNIKGGD
jgi:NitT/TauT family transport system substrate-binding protein